MAIAEPDRLSVLIADDHPVVRMGLVGVVAADPRLYVAAEAGDGREACRRYEECRPDVVLMDLRMPGCDGVEAIECIRHLDPEAKIVILTTFDGEEDIWRGLRAGAKAYLLKDSPGGEIVDCVMAVARGQRVVPAGIASKVAEKLEAEALSRRELEVLRWLATGKSNKEIARGTGITEGTVKFHVTAIMTKLGAKSRTEAVTIAVRRGMIALR
jgi:two-component system NarL family response regulator